ncbi:MAG: Gfo/Idh/MocA family oxidoreductase [Leptospiraceae bacterium]
MKFLICGIGSIGQRHYRNLKSLGHRVAVLRHTDKRTEFIRKFLEGEEKENGPVQIFYSLDEALQEFDPEAVFLANPNSLHMDLALQIAEKGKHLFIEKPLTHTLDGVDKLRDLVEQKKLKVMIGYNLRWHPQLVKMHQMLEDGVIGKVLSAHVEMGENMEDWHPWEDYRDTYAPYRSGGGGAVLCFSHDIDYLYWFLGRPERVLAIGGKMTPLDGDAEDMVKVLFQYQDRSIASLHIDYWQRPHRRVFDLIGTKGTITWDYEAKTLEHSDHSTGEVQTENLDPEFERNHTFIDEVSEFIESIQSDTTPPIPLQQGIDVLEISLQITDQLS